MHLSFRLPLLIVPIILVVVDSTQRGLKVDVLGVIATRITVHSVSSHLLHLDLKFNRRCLCNCDLAWVIVTFQLCKGSLKFPNKIGDDNVELLKWHLLKLITKT